MLKSIIVAATENNVIGKDNKLIWHLPADLKHFKNITSGHSVIMGRKTFESIRKPLPNRRNIIITHNKNYNIEGCEIVNNIEEALELIQDKEEVFIIGGGTIYKEMWNKVDKIYLTRVHINSEGDTTIPIIEEEKWEEISREDYKADEKNNYDYSFIEYKRKI